MMKSFFLATYILTICIQLSAQLNEYQYFSYRVSFIHNFLHPQPDNPIDNYILGTDNQLHQLNSDKNLLFKYSPSFGADVFWHFDFTNDKMGIVTGLGFQMKKFNFRYSTDIQYYLLNERFTTYEIGLPVFYKFGNHIFNKMRFFYIGPRLNYILKVKNKNNFHDDSNFYLDKPEIKPLNISILGGFNYCSLNFEIEYQINSIFSKSYQNNSGNSIYSTQKGNFIFLKTSIHFCPRYFLGQNTSCFPFRIRRIHVDPIRY